MEEKEIFSISLANGTQISNLELNGNNFISKNKIVPEIFEGGLTEVYVSGNKGTVYVIKNAKLIQILEDKTTNTWWFILAEKSIEELMFEQMAANISSNRAILEDALCEEDETLDERLAIIEDVLCELDERINGGE